MDGQLGVMIDLEEALYMLKKNDMYSAGIAFFSALGYPVEPLDIAINESMSRFVYVVIKNRCIFSSDETNAMQSVASISWLFTLSNDIPALLHIEKNRIGNMQISSMNCFCVELDCALHSRSIQAFILTKIISKVFNTPVIVLFKHANKLLLAAVFVVSKEAIDISKTFLSDWYLYDPVQEDVLMTLSNWNFGYYCDDNFYTFFMDLVHSMARSYFIYYENSYFLKYGCNNIFLNNPSVCGEIIRLDGISYICAAELTDQFIEINPRKLYGYDYMNDDESIEIIIDDGEWMLEELFNMDETVRMLGEADLSDEEEELDFELDEDEESDFELEDEEMHPPLIDIDNIDDDVFKDPIKMLEYLELLEQRGVK
jgi:hypothetical protein